jgi:hypothetical protein
MGLMIAIPVPLSQNQDGFEEGGLGGVDNLDGFSYSLKVVDSSGIGTDFAVSSTLNATPAYGQPLSASKAQPGGGVVGCEFIIPAGGSITFGLATGPGVSGSALVTRPQYANPAGALPLSLTVRFRGNIQPYITQIAGAVIARWI